LDGALPVTGPDCSEYSASLVPVVSNHTPTVLAAPAVESVTGCCAAFRMPMNRALSVPMIGDGNAPPGLPGGAFWLARCRWPWARCR
jgi:hypothetical protein